MKLTIVLTIYNKEPYLARALDSIMSQQGVVYDDYEVVAVNDGSTDGSGVILNNYAQSDSRLRVITQQNQGLSIARNVGLSEARGEYVWFVDADDIISPRAVLLVCKAADLHPDIIPLYAKTEGCDKIRNAVPATVKTGKDILLSETWEVCGVFNVFRRSFLLDNNLSFYPHIYHEDVEFTPRALYVAKSAIVVPEVLYTVYKTSGSIGDNPNPKRAYDCLFVAERNYKLIDDNNEWGTDVGRALCKRVSLTITSSLKLILKRNKSEWREFNNSLYEKSYLFRSMVQSGVFRYRLLVRLFYLFPQKYIQVFRSLHMIRR